ncbi:hypothetical protein NQ317_002353 [Molorchus minor]|uniref:Uncharacterized protein n=1 Tax=Molorchus minor TaxID=1323400 RepID=A0ABQ9IRZ9_9CUCU|nr:hypothetical protein NQ317_002353 [Molorchus minor]
MSTLETPERYYQPAGPLITVPHGHGQPQPPPPPSGPLTKSAPLSEASPTSTTPSASHEPPPPPSSNGDSSDSEVIITSVTTGKESAPPPSHPPAAYRYTQYSSAPPGYPYSYPAPYHYPTPAPPNPSYAHHDICYPPSPYVHHKYPSYRRYLSSAPYYPTNHQEVYSLPPAAPSQQSQQVVTATPVSATGTAYSAPTGPPPPPTLMETYSAPQPTLVETYQPPPHYFTPAYGPAPSCYTHSPSRTIPYINATYQSCPCPMQSCPKNVLTGPLTGDSKRSNILSISKDSMPLPPVALALPLEPASATGPPSPARGSAGMPPPPSPAGATYQPPPPPTKQESQSPESHGQDCNTEKKRKARVGKAMVRSNMQNTMLLMCNPTNYVGVVKREIESPKEKEEEHKKEILSADEDFKSPVKEPEQPSTKNEESPVGVILQPVEPKEEKPMEKENADALTIVEPERPSQVLQPIVNTVAENVKVKNMKRKLSLSKERVPEPELTPSSRKRQKLGSYKYLIRKDTNLVKIHNGKRKLMEKSLPAHQRNGQIRQTKIKLKKSISKRKISTSKEINNKRFKLSQPLTASNLNNYKNSSKIKEKTVMELNKVKEPVKKAAKMPVTVNSKTNNSKSAVAVLDSLFASNNVDRIIESVVSESCMRTTKDSAVKSEKCSGSLKEPIANKKSTNKNNGQMNKLKNECKKTGVGRRKSKCKEVVVPQIITRPRRPSHFPRWSNGWRWEGEPYDAKVFLNSDEATVMRRCYPAMRHRRGGLNCTTRLCSP